MSKKAKIGWGIAGSVVGLFVLLVIIAGLSPTPQQQGTTAQQQSSQATSNQQTPSSPDNSSQVSSSGQQPASSKPASTPSHKSNAHARVVAKLYAQTRKNAASGMGGTQAMATALQTMTKPLYSKLLPYSMARQYYQGDPTRICGKDVQEGRVKCDQISTDNGNGVIACPSPDAMIVVYKIEDQIRQLKGTGVQITLGDVLEVGGMAASAGCVALPDHTIVQEHGYEPGSWMDMQYGGLYTDKVTVLTGERAGQILYLDLDSSSLPWPR